MGQFPGSLHSHSEYSNLRLRDSIIRTKDLLEYAGSLGHTVIGITEHETVANAIKLEREYAKVKEKYPNLKLVRGNEIYLCRNGLTAETFERGEDKYYHFCLYAKNAKGHQQIRELSTRAWMRSYVGQGKMRRVPTYYSDLVEIIEANPGNVIGSTACLGGWLGTKILKWASGGRKEEEYSQIIDWLKRIEKIFGEDHFFLEMQPSNGDEQECVNREILNLSSITGIPYIVTTDSHYLRKEDQPIHKAYLNSQDGDREVDAFYATTYHMGTEELESYLKYLTREQLDSAYYNVQYIANQCEDYSLLKELKIPSLDWGEIPEPTLYEQVEWIKHIPWLEKFLKSDFNGDRAMAHLIINKLNSNPKLRYERSYNALNENLEMTWISSEVNKAHWSAYFLNLRGILDACWEAGTLVGPGRGSGVGFYLLYILDIIQINPLWETTPTFSWRFLNPSRVSVLDIDTDIEGGKRPQVLAALRNKYGQDRVSNVVTFGTEGSRSAIQSAARGIGIDNDVALYISSLVPSDRGQMRTLKQCYYGDEEKGFAPIPLFIQSMKEYPELWEVAQKIEGLCCQVGEHAGGIIFVDEPFTNSTALMKVPNGDTVTQFDLHDSEAVSLIKIDLLSIEALDKMHVCLDLLKNQGYIEEKATLKETYETYLGIYNIERKEPKMWEMVWNHEIQALFQMEKQSGIQGIALVKPKSVDELAVLNSVIRLMAPDKNSETPLETWAKYRRNINLWIKEMREYGLTEDEIQWLSSHSAITEGICESQEGLMSLVQEERLGGHDLGFADKCRKALAKKIGSLFDECEKTFFQTLIDKHCSEKLGHYVWDILLRVQRGYSFNRSHCLAYSLVGLQEMNLAYKYPIIFWNCACLITDSGGAEDNENEEEPEIVDIYEPEDFTEYEYEDAPDKKTKKKKRRGNNYDKIAKAIGKMRSEGIEISPPDVNTSQYTFYPDVENNKILFGFRGMLNVGDDVIEAAIANRPYSSPKDFVQKVNPKKTSMISLIKSGAFDSMMDRKLCMGWYLWENCDKKSRLTLQNMPSLIKYNLIPEEYNPQCRVYEFTRYLKAITKADPAAYEDYYTLDNRAINFLTELGKDDLITSDNLAWFVERKAWDKVYQNHMDILRNWLTKNKDNILTILNQTIFKEEWNKYALGTLSAWEMEVMCFYYHEHELSHINQDKYGIVDFNSQPEDPVIERSFVKGGKQINLFKLVKICGTCIAKDKSKGTAVLLTPTGVVSVRFRKEYFSIYDRQISERRSDGTKKVVEKSWFNRGSMLVIQGIRSGDEFIPKKYASSTAEQLYKITSIDKNGDLTLTHTRYQGGIEEDV